MGQKIITIRGRTFAVESKSGSQTAYIIREFEKRTDAQLDSYAAESESDRDALISAIGFDKSARNVPDSGYRFIGKPS